MPKEGAGVAFCPNKLLVVVPRAGLVGDYKPPKGAI
jgi:hypothetical protein